MTIRDRIAALLGVSAYSEAVAMPRNFGPSEEEIERLRHERGGQLATFPTTRTRWYLASLEAAQRQADQGNLELAGQLWRAMRRDGVIAGLLATRTDGLVRLPRRFIGDPEIVAALEGRDGTRSVFDAMFPIGELALLAADGIGLGVGVAELLPVAGRDYPVLVRLDPEFLRYNWDTNRWFYRSVAGELPITPGDGRWILHIDGGRVAPWTSGKWHALGRAWIDKEHALLHSANWEAKLANPARAAVAPSAASENQRLGFLDALIAWGVNTVFELPPGWDVKIIESNGVGYQAFGETVQRSNHDFMIALVGQVVTVSGGTGFSNQDVPKSVLSSLLEATGDALGHTISTQGIPPYVVARWGEAALAATPSVNYDTESPKDAEAQAKAISALGDAIQKLNVALVPYGQQVDALELTAAAGILTKALPPAVVVAEPSAVDGVFEDEAPEIPEPIEPAALGAA